MADLPLWLADADSTNGPRNWVTQNFDFINNGVDSPTSNSVTDNSNSSASVDTSFLLPNTPGDFDSILTLNVRARTGRTGNLDWLNTRTVEARVVKESDGTVLAAATSGGAFTLIRTISGTFPPLENSSEIPFAYVNTGATKTDWDDARLELRTTVTKDKGGDTLTLFVYEIELTGTYTTGTVTHTYTATGGATTGGTAPPTVRRSYTASGGAASGGSAAVSRQFVLLSSGGATTGGAATTSKLSSYSYAASGGATTGGAAATELFSATATYTYTASGGAASGGSAAVSRQFVLLSSGGATTGGAATTSVVVGTTTYTYSATGGATTSGVAIWNRLLIGSATGGIATGGTAVASHSRGYIASGGAATGGAATTSSTQVYAYVASGGATTGGAAATSTPLTHEYTASGGAATGGAAATLVYTPNTNPSQRDLNPTVQTAVAQPITKPRYLIEIHFDSVIRYSTREQVSWNGFTWNSVGARVAQLETKNIPNAKAAIALPNDNNQASALVLNEGSQDQLVKIWILYGESPFAVEDAVLVYQGVTDGCSIEPMRVTIQSTVPDTNTSYAPRIYVDDSLCSHLPPAGSTLNIAGEVFVIERE